MYTDNSQVGDEIDCNLDSSPATTASSSSSSLNVTGNITHTTRTHKSHGACSETNPSFIPYRNSVLTSILRDSLGGNCRTCFLLTISDDIIHFGESISTCRFGQRCGEVICKVVANTERSLIERLKEAEEKVKTCSG